MSNMSYCRMQNTFQDLQDVKDNWEETTSPSELRYRQYILELCREIINWHDKEGEYVPHDQES